MTPLDQAYAAMVQGDESDALRFYQLLADATLFLLLDHEAEGERINPLDKIPGFDRVLIFIDADDEPQVDWALRQMSNLGEQRTRVILVKGAPLELMRPRNVQV